MTDRRVLITGSREFEDDEVIAAKIHEEVFSFLESDYAPEDRLIFIVGGARGADSWAAYFVKLYKNPNVTTELHKARWDIHGNKAGILRNIEMVESGADICLAFFKHGAENKGTSHCVKIAKKAGIPVVETWG